MLPVPENEAERLERLRSYNILDTQMENQFDDLTDIASKILETPICLLTLMDTERNWFKSKVGTDVPESPRNISFCQYTIMGDDVFEIENMVEDERFRDNPLVKEQPNLRYYIGAPLVDRDGIRIGAICGMDLEPRKMTSEQKEILSGLARSAIRLIQLRKVNQDQQKYINIFNLIPDPICVAGEDGFMKMINPAFCKQLGWDEHAMRAMPMVNLVYEADKVQFQQELGQVTQEETRIQVRLISKSGSIRPYHWSIMKASNHIFAVAYDMSTQLQINQELQDAKVKAEEASTIKDEFLSNISHEFRTPLNAIIGFTELLSSSNLTPEQETYLQTIESASDGLRVIVNDLLDAFKLNSGELRLEEKPVDLHKLIQGTVLMHKPIAEAKNIDISHSVKLDKGQVISADATRLRQMVSNLLSNAIKFTEHGRVTVQVSECSEASKRWVEITVSDTGIGIEQHHLGKIFSRFGQAKASTTRRFGGTGLGLSIVRMIAELHGGTVSVSSKVGIGSTFTARIPFRETDDHAVEQRDDKKTIDQYDAPLQGVSILVVEDNPQNQVLAATYLRRVGAQVALVNDAQAALKSFEKSTFDLILMDIELPDMSGIEVTKSIRNELKLKTPIIACSAHSFTDDIERCLEVGMNGYVMKPYSASQLVDSVISHLPSFHQAVVSKQPNKGEIEVNLIKLIDREGKVLVSQLLHIFNNRAEADIAELETHFRNRDWEAIRKKAHFLVTTFNTINLSHGVVLSKRLERVVKSTERNNLYDHIKDLISFIELVRSISKNYCYE